MSSFHTGTLQCMQQESKIKMGDVEKEQEVCIQRCAWCHTMENRGRHKTEPSLHGLLEQKTGQAPDSLTQMPKRAKASPRNWRH